MTAEKTPREEIQDFLERHIKMVLGINEEGNYPNTSLMHYAVDKSLHIHFGTKRSFGKYAALKKDSRVSFVVVEECIDPLRVVDGRGEARELEGEEAEMAYLLFKTENKSKWYVEHSSDFAMFQIKPKSFRWLDGSSGELKMETITFE
ncbi:MAG: pyridoxamine 5'-phosphate oxidase family protein [Parcubacteria group bacterium]|nr:pyridoxamine 5'-phosphate oxidase family protein [Parcubacteria group bacterium]